MKNPPDPLVFIKLNKLVECGIKLKMMDDDDGLGAYIPPRCYITPCAAFMRYIDSIPVVGTREETLTKKKGFTTRFNTSTEIKAGVSVGFMGCEASLEVTSKYEYEETVSSETTQTWKQTLTEGTYIIYQNVVVYAYKFYTMDNSQIDKVNRLNPGINLRRVKGLPYPVMFVPINRNDSFTLRYQDATWNPVEYDVFTQYLIDNPNKWNQ
ncbi:hypothetical protein ACTA71_000116 [Dictyostelium dimigraforme]